MNTEHRTMNIERPMSKPGILSIYIKSEIASAQSPARRGFSAYASESDSTH